MGTMDAVSNFFSKDDKVTAKDGSRTAEDLTHAPTDAAVLEERAGAIGRIVITALDKAVKIQGGAIKQYVSWLKKKNPDATPEELQDLLDKHFKRVATATGAGSGAAASIPGIGMVYGAVAVGADSLAFLDAAAVYTMASALIRGADISDPEQRRSLILMVLAGSSGTAIVDTLLGDLSQENGASTAALLTRFSAPKLSEVNEKLMKSALKSMNKRFRRAWLGKLMPLGVGAVLGSVANRKLADNVVDSAHASLGALPRDFADIDPVIDGEVLSETVVENSSE
ncbi:hypothetical protein I6I10_11225 [Corynebacterium glucuronolyticum]|uniref:EcsC protein family protein n=1 Tax=Corynebacterium glucuronolyticum TaxID=39791 RepID=A0A7T4EEQ9_9CORY|nr:hypothetical protein [Corynebacterium glucuronolyticum]QQB46016.1 hypothetical protein I6I10_11225 [Corynebacterium glucuronolyticum]WKD63249.1 hypothetical protein CGLUCO_04915 [Corynebacterium glucuronolyticum DSM 44120]SMB77434.1 hypothetical protein SAMN05660745_00084 [Corynebacterium glucuronolyticum]